MTDLFVALISTTEYDLRDPKPLRLRWIHHRSPGL